MHIYIIIYIKIYNQIIYIYIIHCQNQNQSILGRIAHITGRIYGPWPKNNAPVSRLKVKKQCTCQSLEGDEPSLPTGFAAFPWQCWQARFEWLRGFNHCGLSPTNRLVDLSTETGDCEMYIYIYIYTYIYYHLLYIKIECIWAIGGYGSTWMVQTKICSFCGSIGPGTSELGKLYMFFQNHLDLR